MAGFVIALMNQARAQNAAHDKRRAAERSWVRRDAIRRNNVLKEGRVKCFLPDWIRKDEESLVWVAGIGLKDVEKNEDKRPRVSSCGQQTVLLS